MVGTTRFEHATSWTRTKRSTKLSYVPTNMKLVPRPTSDMSQKKARRLVVLFVINGAGDGNRTHAISLEG